MFTMGIVARNNGWLEGQSGETQDADDADKANDESETPLQRRDLKSQMDISPPVQRCMVLVEIASMVGLFSLDLENGPIWYPILAFILSGIYCVDMGLAVVQTFQEYSMFHTEHKWTRYLSKAAYTVYLIHPAVIVAVTSLYIWGYNQVVGELSEDRIVFDRHEEEGTGGGDYFWLGWILVNILSHLVVWPLSWFLANIPVLRDVL